MKVRGFLMRVHTKTGDVKVNQSTKAQFKVNTQCQFYLSQNEEMYFFWSTLNLTFLYESTVYVDTQCGPLSKALN